LVKTFVCVNGPLRRTHPCPLIFNGLGSGFLLHQLESLASLELLLALLFRQILNILLMLTGPIFEGDPEILFARFVLLSRLAIFLAVGQVGLALLLVAVKVLVFVLGFLRHSGSGNFSMKKFKKLK
jgi:hypothetical protein